MLALLLSLSQITGSAPQGQSTFGDESTSARRMKRSPGKRFSRWRRRHLLEISLGLLIIALLGLVKPLGKGKLPAFLTHTASSRSAAVSDNSGKSDAHSAAVSATDADDGNTITLAMVGDIMLMNIPNPFRDDGIRNILREADITFGNLEAPLSRRGKPIALKFRNGRLLHNEFIFRASPRRAESLRNSGFDVVSLANNHMMDCGPLALEDTLTALKRYNIAHVGAGANQEAARQQVVITRKGVRVAFLAYIQDGDDMLPGTEGFAASENRPGMVFVYGDAGRNPTEATLEMLREDIGEAKSEADLVAVSFHWGRERHVRPTPFQRHLAHRTIEAGADLIVGHHSHNLQGIEVYGGKPIFYSLGNFVFRSWDSLTRRTGIAHLTLDSNGVRRVLFHPALIRRTRPYLSQGQTAVRTNQRMINLSRELNATMFLAKQNGRPVAVLELRKNTKQSQSPKLRLTAATKKTTSSDFVEITKIVPNIRIDLRYATKDNVFGTKFYEVDRAYLRRATALKLKHAQENLEPYGLRLKVWDAYRPLGVQKAMWQQVSDPRYVAPPSTGSDHNRGAAVDVTLVDRQGKEVEMPTDHDDFSPRAHIGYNHPSGQVRQHRYWLQQAMKKAGFRPLSTEWWHFSDPDARRFPLSSLSLKQLSEK